MAFSRVIAENAGEDDEGTSKFDLEVSLNAILSLNLLGDFDLDFNEKALFANSRYAFMHSSTVICSLPSMIAMILFVVS